MQDVLDDKLALVSLSFCPRRFNIDPPCRLNFDPGLGAGIAAAGCA